MKKISIAFLILIFFGSVFLTNDQWTIHSDSILELPSLKFPFGTDSLGRNLFLRCLVGAKYSLLIGLISAGLSLFFGVIYGFISGYFGGAVDRVLMRFCDLLMSIPHLILMCLAAFLFKNIFASLDISFIFIICAITTTTWMGFAKLARNLIIKEKLSLYVESAVVTGATQSRIIFKHLWPNLRSPVIVWFVLQLPRFILLESFLSFFGLGIESPETSWGLLIKEGWQTFTVFPHLVIFPSVMLFLTLLALNVVFKQFNQDQFEN